MGLNVGENDAGRNYHYYAGQFAYKWNYALGEGNYRAIVDWTTKKFSDEDGNDERRLAGFLSFDQELGDIFGAWIRFGWQDDSVLIDFDALYSGGINIIGSWYGREQDNIGIGYAYLHGDDDSEFDADQVFEVYWRVVFTDMFAATADFQYIDEDADDSDKDINGIVAGIWMTAEF